MNLEQIAAQLYTVRDFIRTPADIAESLKKISKIGYRAVQVSGMGPIPESELMEILDGEGLICCATHEDSQTILSNPRAIAERLDKLNCTYAAYPYPSGVRLDTLDDVKRLAASLDAAGKTLREAGKVLTYHNHHVEFRRFDGQMMLEVLYDGTDPANLQGEIDTYWVQNGGGDPADWCARLKNRLPVIHLKDYLGGIGQHTDLDGDRERQSEMAGDNRYRPRLRVQMVHRGTGYLPRGPVRFVGYQLPVSPGPHLRVRRTH